jgi:hypothetical protein
MYPKVPTYSKKYCGIIYKTISGRFPTMTLIVEVVSGQHIPRPKNDDDTSDIMDPYVQVRSSYIEYRKGWRSPVQRFCHNPLR